MQNCTMVVQFKVTKRPASPVHLPRVSASRRYIFGDDHDSLFFYAEPRPIQGCSGHNHGLFGGVVMA
jgi:hypothetical protein